MTGVICIGIAVHDFIFGMAEMPTRAQKYRARALTEAGGGNAATAAAAIARLGGTARLAARLGDDMVGDVIVRELRGYGVDCSLVRRFPGHRSSLSAVLVDEAGERMIVNYRETDLSDDTGWLPDPLPSDIGAVLGDNRWPAGAAAMFRKARKAGIPAVFDPESPFDEDSAEAMKTATHLAFPADALLDYEPAPDVRTAVRRVWEATGAFVCATDGPREIVYSTTEGVASLPAFAVEAVDTLGAGDVWHGAFALALAEDKSEVDALRFASAAAAIKCTRFGGRAGVPDRAEVEAFLRERA